MKKAYTGKGSHPRHMFLFDIGGKIKKISAKVRAGKGQWKALFNAEHVIRAEKLNGPGDAQNCAGALCVYDHSNIIPHKFTGYVDFWDRRAFLSCRNSAETNLPKNCVAWKHNRPEIAKMFDSASGRKKLIQKIKNEGPIEITFTSPTYSGGSNKSGKRGNRDPEKRKFHTGHRARIIRVKGGLPSELTSR